MTGDLSDQEKTLRDALLVICPKGISADCRIIQRGDSRLLLPEEAASIPIRNPIRRDASGAARYVARQLLAQHGLSDYAILRGSAGQPIWPDNIGGSLAHDDEVAVAATGNMHQFLALGIDVEPAIPLPSDIRSIVRTTLDKTDSIDNPDLCDRVLFCAKEAVYKAVYPLDKVILNFDDINIDCSRQIAKTSTGKTLQLVFCTVPRIIVLAFILKKA
jgi:4'-phosphopantetheinyl transferase EntD